MERLTWMLQGLSNRLWVSISLYGFIAIFSALAAVYLKQFIPLDFSQSIGAHSIDEILNIMAASMLSVTVFSLSVMVSAYNAASSNVTPRATKLLLDDETSHRALSTFLGAFIFSIVGIVALKAGIYGQSGVLILFIVTIGVILMILLTLFQWIEYLARLGRMSEMIQKVESAAHEALEDRLKSPYLGGVPLSPEKDIPAQAQAVLSDRIGYVQHINMSILSSIAEQHSLIVYVAALPGKFLTIGAPMVFVSGVYDESALSRIHDAFIMDGDRSFKQDPRFGLVVMYEIASRALSPAVNDPGTAIHVIGKVVRILSLWAKRAQLFESGGEALYPHVYVPALKLSDLFDDFYPQVSRDGAALLEVQIRLQKSYRALAELDDNELRQATADHSVLSLKRAEQALTMEEDKQVLRKLASDVCLASARKTD